MKSTMRRYPE